MSQKVGPFGGNKGNAFDDGAFGYNGVRKVIVGENGHGVDCIKIEYEKDGKFETLMHGSVTGTLKEFVLNYPTEYITSIQGTYSDVARYNTTIVKTLVFKTSQGRTSPTFGNTAFFKTEFVVEGKAGTKLVAFHGRSGSALDSIGAHFVPSSVPRPVAPPPAKKLEAQGGHGGTAWDDGFYEDVKKVYVGQGDSGVSFVKFEYYDRANKVIVGDGHGKKTVLGAEEFELDFPNEYIVSVEGCYDNLFGTEAEVVTMLRFKTNKRTSAPFGMDGGTTFALEMKDHKIVGFHGKAGDFVHQVGVHVSPITKS